MFKINKIYIIMAIIIPVSSCTTLGNYYNQYHMVTIEDNDYIGNRSKKIATNDEYFTGGKFYKDNMDKLEKYDIDINSISDSAVTIYNLDEETPDQQQVKNDSYENISDIMQEKIVLTPPSTNNNDFEDNNAITIYPVDGTAIVNQNKKIEAPGLLPPIDSDNDKYLSPFKQLEKPKNLLTK